MNHQTMLSRAEREVCTRALKIKSSVEAGDLDCEYYGALGYISSLRDMGIFNASQYITALSVFDAALYEAEDQRAKKIAPSAANTESDKSSKPVFSLEQKQESVKSRPEACVHMGIFPGGRLEAEISGSSINLLAILSSLTMNLRKAGIPEPLISAAFHVNTSIREVSPDA